MLSRCILFLLATCFVTAAHANIVGVDSRISLAENAKPSWLTAEEVRDIRMKTGLIYCPGRIHNNPRGGSAVLVGDGKTLITNAHNLVDEFGRERGPLSECYFRNQPFPYSTHTEIALSDVTRKEIVSNWGGAMDYAVLRLQNGISGVRGFPVKAAVQHGSELIVVSGMQRRAPPFHIGAPIVQKCLAREIFAGTTPHNSAFYGDCDITDGASGGATLARVDGRLVVVGIVAGGGLWKTEERPVEHADGEPYNPLATPEYKRSYSFHVAIRDLFETAILRISE